MTEQAHEELDALDALGPGHRSDLRVVALRVYVYQELGCWEQMASMATVLCQRLPDDPQWPISLAYATRRSQGLSEAREVLWKARLRFPDEAMIQFNLACYECQLGRLAEARECLDEACRLAPACRQLALEEADLAALRGENGG